MKKDLTYYLQQEFETVEEARKSEKKSLNSEARAVTFERAPAFDSV